MCLGDFSLYGPLGLTSTVTRGASSSLMPTRAFAAGCQRLKGGPPSRGDSSRETGPRDRDRLFAALLRDQWGWIRTLVQAIDAYSLPAEATRATLYSVTLT